jgi:hypothetical protein
LFTKHKGGRELVFLDPLAPQTQPLPTDKKIDIILSPSLYWVKKMVLPLKSAREVSKLLPTIFEEFLPDGEYSYFTYKEGDQFLVFAYEQEKIKSLLLTYEIPLHSVGDFYFAQDLAPFIDGGVKLNDQEVLAVEDGVVILLPQQWSGVEESLVLNSSMKLEHKVRLDFTKGFVGDKSLYKLALLLGVLVVVVSVEIFITTTKIGKIQEQKTELFTHYKLKSTMIQNRSILKKYKKIFTDQSHLREEFVKFLEQDRNKAEVIDVIEFDGSVLKMKILNTKTKKRTLSEVKI